MLNTMISKSEVKESIMNAKRGKATGIDEIPVEVLNNTTAVAFLVSLFQACFASGVIPEEWTKGIINPVLKSGTNDPRDSLLYRGITLMSCVYKIFCSVLNKRLQSWCHTYDKIADEQNGFRPDRSTVDHLFSLSSIIEPRKLRRKLTFIAFIDLRKAYDWIPCKRLLMKLQNLGIDGNMLNMIGSIYNDTECCVRINGKTTNWFSVTWGLKQGCLLSTTLFNLYINDLVTQLKQQNIGVNLSSRSVQIMLYADNITLLGETESDLQELLDSLQNWCEQNGLCVNSKKRKCCSLLSNVSSSE